MDYDSEDVSAIGTLEQVNFGVDIIPVGLEICNEIKRVHGYFLGFGEGGLRVVNQVVDVKLIPEVLELDAG